MDKDYIISFMIILLLLLALTIKKITPAPCISVALFSEK